MPLTAADVLAMAQQHWKKGTDVGEATNNSTVSVPKKKPQASTTAPSALKRTSLTMLLTKKNNA
eukprot:10753135-Ditylum_brightwellii.AAC.1